MTQSTLDPSNPTERRELRSRIAYQAAEFYLGSLKHRKVLRTAAVADERGLLLVGVGKRSEQDLLAAWGSLDASQQKRYQREIDALCDDESCILGRFEIDGARFSVTGIASSDEAAGPIAGDLQRIFADSRALGDGWLDALVC